MKFRTLETGEESVLIIDDCQAIALLLSEFLKKLGFEKILHARTGTEGIEKFKEMIRNDEKIPIVLLDYNLPDMNGFSVFSKIIKLKPTTRVIIETSMDKESTSIKQLMGSGVSHYLQKPIRFEHLKEVIDILKAEEHALESKSVGFHDEITNLLNSVTQVSLERVSQYTNTDKEKAQAFLEKLVSDGKAIKIDDIKEVSCNSCGSIRVGQRFHCPSCISSHFKQGKLIQHYDCGNISLADSYENDTCPICRKKIKVLGVDYRVMENYYICNDCNERFAELHFEFFCRKCNNKFKLEKASWKTSPCYMPSINKKKLTEALNIKNLIYS